MLKHNFFFFCIFLVNVSIFAEVGIDQHVKNLSSGTNSEKIAACNFLGKEKSEKKYLTELQGTLGNTNNAKVAVACANALGYIQDKSSIASLKAKIMSESNSDVVYACLMSILNIITKTGYDSDAKYAVQNL